MPWSAAENHVMFPIHAINALSCAFLHVSWHGSFLYITDFTNCFKKLKSADRRSIFYLCVCVFSSAGLQPDPVLVPGNTAGAHHHVSPRHRTQSNRTAGGQQGALAFIYIIIVVRH